MLEVIVTVSRLIGALLSFQPAPSMLNGCNDSTSDLCARDGRSVRSLPSVQSFPAWPA